MKKTFYVFFGSKNWTL